MEGYNGHMTADRPEGCASQPLLVLPLPETNRTTLTAVMKALSDKNRLEIFRLIAGQVEPICVCDIVDRFDIGQSTVSHHLRVLREAELIVSSRRGNWAFYSVDNRGMRHASQLVGALFPSAVPAI